VTQPISLESRLRSAFWTEGRLNRSICVSRRTARYFTDDYRVLLDALGAPTDLVAGWWQGWVRKAIPFFDEPGHAISLLDTSDMEWLTWQTDWSRVEEVMRDGGIEPGLLATVEPGWVLFSPPSSDDMFLYPEVSASD